MDTILFATVSAFLITYFSIPIIIIVAQMKKLYDVPDDRKVHAAPIPSLGGLGIFAGLSFCMMVFIPFGQSEEFQYFMAAALVIFFLGLKDDILVITWMKKLLGQFIAAFLIMYKGGIQIQSMHGFLGIYELSQASSVVFTMLTIIVIINSFNLIDGVDGLAASLGCVSVVSFGVYFLLAGQFPYAMLAFIMAGSLLAFLIFNHSPAKIFMGDTGSLLLGMVNAILVIRFIGSAGDPASGQPLNASPAIGFAVLLVPLFDTLRVFSLRILSRRSPFSPDRNHVHHVLLDLGLSHSHVTYTCVLFNIAFIAYSFLGRGLGTTFLLLSMLAITAAGTGLLIHLRNRRKGPDEIGDMELTPNVFGNSRLMTFRRKDIVLPEDN
jgi:UDP-N-acetylmuramyl pentapeptide phosphotransferase/UDP-N-acetylglucosamine-1-phosphate transferase